VSLIDVVPTIAELVGAPRPEPVVGESLAAALRGQALAARSAPIYFESLQPVALGCGPLRGIVDGRWKYIRTVRPELYDLERDAGENENVFAREPERARDFDRRLTALVAVDRPAGARSSPTLDPATMQRLAALGYLTEGEHRSPEGEVPDPKDCFAAFEAVLEAQTHFNHEHYDEAEADCRGAIAERPTFLMAHSLLGSIALEQGKMEVAERRFRRYLEILKELEGSSRQSTAQSYATSRVHNNLGNALLALDRVGEAIPEYREALRLAPSFAEAHLNLGTALEATGDAHGAIEQYRLALRLTPDFVAAQKSLGQALKSEGEWDEAAAVLTAALRLDPGNADIHHELARVEQKRGNIAAALQHYREALALGPDEMVYNNLAWLYATHRNASVRDVAQAVALATRAAELTEFRNPNVLDTLAAAYASAGRFDEAMATTTRAIELAEAAGERDLAGVLNERLQLYRSGGAYHQTSR
jgi:tetratricopeptide (TPR) repeat protein